MVVTTGLILGGLSALGFGLTYYRLPEWLKRPIRNHPLLTDLVCTASTYKLLHGTASALVAAGVVSVGVSIVLFLPTLGRWWRCRRSQPPEEEGV